MIRNINVTLVGLEFGGAFAHIYKGHPDVGELSTFDAVHDTEHIYLEALGFKWCFHNST